MGAFGSLSGGGGGAPSGSAGGDLGGTYPNPTVPGLAGKVATSRIISTTAPLAGGGDLSANRTLSISPATTSDPGSMSAADKTKLDAINEAACRALCQINNDNLDALTTTFQLTSGTAGVQANSAFISAGSRIAVRPGDKVILRAAARANPSGKNIEVRIFCFDETTAAANQGAGAAWTNTTVGVDFMPGDAAGTWKESAEYTVPSGVFALSIGGRITTGTAAALETVFGYLRRSA